MARQDYKLIRTSDTISQEYSEQAPTFFSYRQREVIRLAPDCLVFINGELLVPNCPQCGARKDIRNDISSVSVSATTGGSPPTCTIELQAPRHEEDKYFRNGQIIFSPMQEVRVYFKGSKLVDGQPSYYPVFWGMVTSVVDSTDVAQQIQLQCVGMLRWWQIMRFALQPSAIFQMLNGVRVSAWQTIFTNKNAYQIIYELSKISMANAANPFDFSQVNVIREPAERWRGRNEELIKYWQTRLGELESLLTMFGVDGTPIALDRRNQQARAQTERRLDAMKGFIATSDFTSDGTLGELGPFEAVLQGGRHVQTQQMSLLEIANQVKQFMGYEFFQQMDGAFWFKPPFYNLDVRPSYPFSSLEDKHIVSWNLGVSEQEVITRLDIRGASVNVRETGASKGIQPYGYHIDYNLAQRYGIRAEELPVLYLRDAWACQLYAIATLSKINARVTRSSVTLVGRPEIKLGFPVWIPSRDAFYYVTGISHSFSYGGPFQTTLALEGRRQKRYDQEGHVVKNAAMVFQPGKSQTPPGDVGTVVPPSTDDEQEEVAELTNKAYKGLRVGYWEEKVQDEPVLQVSSEKIPVTDEEGYEVIGGFPYGRNLAVDEEGILQPKGGFQANKQFGSWLTGASRELDKEAMLSAQPGELSFSWKTVKQWAQKARTLRYGQYLSDTLEARSVTATGKDLVEIAPDDESGECICVPEGASFEKYLELLTAGLGQDLVPVESDE